MGKTAWIVGAGLAGATVNHQLLKAGWSVRAFERSLQFGGLSRSDVMSGVIYEPHGSHIFHTDDTEVWELASSLTPFWRYEHSVKTFARLGEFTWPLQVEELIAAYGEETANQLAGMNATDHHGVRTQQRPMWQPNFEEWCLSIMPQEIYDDFVANYTEKQWGVPGSELDASFAPKRVQVRTDGDKRLFKDAHQGFPDAREGGSYDQMHRALWGKTLVSNISLGHYVNLRALLDRFSKGKKPDAVFLTCPLDDFCDNVYGELEWRGLTFETHVCIPTDLDDPMGTAQTHMVYNFPQKTVPFIRTHEAKVASRQEVPGSVIVKEFPGGPGKYYPVPRGGEMRQRNGEYADYIRSVVHPHGVQVAFVGRLAHFMYYDQDDVMRQAIDVVKAVVEG